MNDLPETWGVSVDGESSTVQALEGAEASGA